MPLPDITLLLTTYQKPWHLRRALRSIAMQQGVRERMELVVTDDGSTDETPQIVEAFRREVNFPVHFTTHPHGEFHPARCRNEGVTATSGEYLLLLDGDCVLPPDHVAAHLAQRKPGVAMLGDCCRLEQDVTQQVSEAPIEPQEFVVWNSGKERRRLTRADRHARLYTFLRHPKKPKLVSNNVGIWRSDFLRVNGFDENYRGWGCEDDDLGQRLKKSGVRLESILRWTNSFHLWHPRDPSAPRSWREGPNVPYFLRRGRLTRCRNGVVKRGIDDLAVRIIGRTAAVDPLIQRLSVNVTSSSQPEIEILFSGGDDNFSRQAECRILVEAQENTATPALARVADVVISDSAFPQVARQFRLSQFDEALAAIG